MISKAGKECDTRNSNIQPFHENKPKTQVSLVHVRCSHYLATE